MIRLLIPIALPSQNRYLGRGFWRLHQDKKKFQDAIGEAFIIEKANGRIPIAYLAPCTVKRTIGIMTYRKRLIDDDNLSIKALLDALVRLELLKDDSPKWLNTQYVSQVSIGKKGKELTEIWIK